VFSAIVSKAINRNLANWYTITQNRRFYSRGGKVRLMQSRGAIAAGTNAAASLGQGALTDALKFIFSWVILLPIGVIVTGKLLTNRLKLEVGSGQLFRIPIKGVLTIEATGAEVILGFTWYLICLLLLGVAIGANVETWVKVHFGIDPGQFNALGFMSSLFSVAVSFIVFLLGKPPTPGRRGPLQERNRLVNKITREKTGLDPNSLPEVKQS
jgi:hypothetical protein